MAMGTSKILLLFSNFNYQTLIFLYFRTQFPEDIQFIVCNHFLIFPDERT